MSPQPTSRRRRSLVASLSSTVLLGLGVLSPAGAATLEPAPLAPAPLGPVSLDGEAQLAAYDDVQLQARTNLLVNDKGYNLPPGSSFNSISPDINAAGDVAFRVNLVPDSKDPSQSRPGVWFGGDGTGGLVHTGDIGSRIDNDTTLNDDGDIAFTLSDGGFDNDLYLYDADKDTAGPIGTAPLFPSSYRSPHINNAGAIGFQANFSGGRGYAALIDGTGVMYAGDESIVPSSPYTYLYTPSHNNAGQIAAKVATSDDLVSDIEIRLFEADGSSERVLANQSVDPSSPYSEFNNSLAVNDNGTVAVIATRADTGQQVVVRSDGTTTTEIAVADPAGTIRELDYFAPAINNSGQVAFRAVDAGGQAIYIGDGSSLVRVVGKGDVVETDLGTAQIGQHDDSPVFGGAPAINDSGDIVFTAGVHPQGDNQVEWGSGVFVAYAGETAEPDGQVQGVVTDANDGQPVAAAAVTATDGDGTVVGETSTGADGGYGLALAPGSYTVTASAPDYGSASADVTVEPEQVSTVDLSLGTAVIEVDPAELRLSGHPGEVHEVDLTVRNAGSAELTWTLSDDAAWLSTSTAGGTLAAGASATVAVTADSADLEEGTHEATIVVSGNAARQPSVEVPVRLVVAPVGAGYDVAVNVGGPEYVDADGVVWHADRRHTDGGWGYVGRHHRTKVTSQDVAGADDPALLQDLRDGEFSYRFDDVPAGSYLVDLRFAELRADAPAGSRQFDVIVDGAEVLTDHDVAAEVGGLTADVHTVVVDHDGGDLVVELGEQRRSRFPILNALRVTAR